MNATFSCRGFRFAAALGAACLVLPAVARAKPNCEGLPDAGRLRSVLQTVVKEGAAKNGGMGNQEWAAVVNRDGIVCAIVFSGTTRSDQWPGSRVTPGKRPIPPMRSAAATMPFQLRTYMPQRSRGKVSTASLLPLRRIRLRYLGVRRRTARLRIPWWVTRSGELSCLRAGCLFTRRTERFRAGSD